MSFTSVSTHKRVGRNEQSLFYATMNQVALQQLGKLRVIMADDNGLCPVRGLCRDGGHVAGGYTRNAFDQACQSEFVHVTPPKI